jgi:hypothetical protein
LAYIDLGIFHVYAHQYSCQVLFSPRNLVGVGLTDGESCKRFWAAIRHIIASLRYSSQYSRRQILTSLGHAVGALRHYNLGATFFKSFAQALGKINETKAHINEYCKGDNCEQKLTELKTQRRLMKEFFDNPEEANVDIEDNICCTLIAIRSLELQVAHRHLSGTLRRHLLS